MADDRDGELQPWRSAKSPPRYSNCRRQKRAWFEDARGTLLGLYGRRPGALAHADTIFDCVVEAYRDRPEPLRLLDLERQMTPDWFERPNLIGYVLYPQRLSGTRRGLLDRLDYLQFRDG